MAQLVLKGHATRGKEVINLLKTLGAKSGYVDTSVGFYYFIECGRICSTDVYPAYATIFTIEEFLEKYPYKVGDEVEFKSIGDANLKSKIIYMEWNSTLNKVLYTTEDDQVISTEDITETKSIPPYMDYDIKTNKEEDKDMEEKDKAKAPDLKGEDYSDKRFGYKIPNGYEFDTVYNGNIILKPIEPQYPKTYEECCDIVNASPYVKLVYDIFDGQTYSYDEDNLQIYENLRKLKICRNAYWKIAGEEMGLGKPWEPDWNHINRKFYCIYNSKNIIVKNIIYTENKILAFPTEEMRDIFYENFKELIEQCKELL